jgi:hypothetical protein
MHAASPKPDCRSGRQHVKLGLTEASGCSTRTVSFPAAGCTGPGLGRSTSSGCSSTGGTAPGVSAAAAAAAAAAFACALRYQCLRSSGSHVSGQWKGHDAG